VTGKPCEHCDGHLVVYSSRRSKCGKFQAQWLRCYNCKQTVGGCQLWWLDIRNEKPKRKSRIATTVASSPIERAGGKRKIKVDLEPDSTKERT